MLLSKVKSFRPFILWKTYSVWIGFCVCILILTNGFTSLTLIREYRFSIPDVLLTYGLLIFWGLVEAGILAALLVLVEVLLERVFKRQVDLLFRVILLVGLVVTWGLLFRAAMRFVLG